MAIFAKERTAATVGEARERAQAALCDANRAFTGAEEAVARADRESRGPDAIARAQANADLPELRLRLAKAQVAQMKARQAHDDAIAAWKAERAAHHQPRYAAALRKLDAALEKAREANADACAVWDEARRDGAPMEFLAWHELNAERPSMATRLDSWRQYLKRNGWL